MIEPGQTRLGHFAILLSCLLTLMHGQLDAQFTLDGQVVVRSEYRHGYNQLIPEGAEPAAFIAHRARLHAQYATGDLTFFMSVQDVRTWGSTPQIKLTDDFLSVHEAWGQLNLGDNWAVKLGRQELNYDNFRFLGNLDWALQARAHDFALVKYESGEARLHFGGGFNQDAQRLTGNVFTTPNQYKVAQMLRYENRAGSFQYSLLLWNDGRQFLQLDTLGRIVDQDTRYRLTLGLPTLRYQLGNSALSLFYYHQLGRDVAGRTVNAYDVSAQYLHHIDIDTVRGSNLRLAAGFEVLSGTSTTGETSNKSFSPLYGTNHLFNGYMDLFYVGGAFENSVGLRDYFLKGRWNVNRRLFLQADGHLFYAQGDVQQPDGAGGFEALDPRLGTELDMSLGFLINNAVSLQAGYSQLFATDTFQLLKGVPNADDRQNWAYVMFLFRPTMRNKFIGILL